MVHYLFHSKGRPALVALRHSCAAHPVRHNHAP